MKLISACVVFLHAMTAYAFPQPQGSSGGNLGVECKTQKTGDGQYKVNCEGVNQDAIALRSEHILWLQGPSGEKSVVDIEIPNYKIAELIKAGFKTTEGEGPKINVLLKKPEQTYEAQVDELKPSGGVPTVNLQYEPVDKTVVHFPNDKPYSPLSGPILPPLAGGSGTTSSSSSNARPQRHSVYAEEQQFQNHQQQPRKPARAN